MRKSFAQMQLDNQDSFKEQTIISNEEPDFDIR